MRQTGIPLGHGRCAEPEDVDGNKAWLVPSHRGRGRAAAHDGSKTLGMLRRQPREVISGLLARLDTAIGTAKPRQVPASTRSTPLLLQIAAKRFNQPLSMWP